MRKRMTLEDFVSFAVSEIQKATEDAPELAKRRLQALKRNVDDVLAGIAKMSAEDTESETVQVEVTTAFAPTKAAGDRPMDDVTTTEDQSSLEIDATAVNAATSDSAFAENLKDVAKAIEKLKAGLGGATEQLRAPSSKRADATRDGRAAREGRPMDLDEDGWPIDMATDTFLKGGAADGSDPMWGFDPAEVASRRR